MRSQPSQGARSRTLLETWERRLQHVKLRTKIVVPMVLLAAAPAVTVGAFTIFRSERALREGAAERLRFDTATKARAVEEFLEAVQEDLLFLSRSKAVRDIAGAPPERLDQLRGEAEREFLLFSRGKRAYYQVRYLDGLGHELVRLNVEKGLPQVVSRHHLQDKSRRYYVKAAMTLEPGEIYVSPMDLNVEHGEVEIPHRAVVRYATPVAGGDGKGRGLLAINVDADYLLSLVGPLPSGAEAWLVGEDGTYLGYVGASDDRRELFSLAKQRRLDRDFPAHQVSGILEDPGGAELIETADSLVFRAPVASDAAASKPAWTLLAAHPRGPIEAPIRQLMTFLSAAVVLVVLVAGVLGVLVAHYLSRPVASLRPATREIAAGNLSRRVEVSTGDELEGLANDFNAMTEQLSKAQERLAAWNKELEREVARQTSDLHRLQTGLARADKLASIGQMTAGVMHEIGNPLAAIKTKIQVAEEDRRLSRELLAEVLAEVDRLATFLHSFSRLARLREPQMQPVSLADVVQGVITLVVPELGRRGIALRIDSGAGASAGFPTIRGDPDQLRQLLINLVLNAAEASPTGGEVLIRVRGGTDRGGGSMEVEDHGAGMPPETTKKVWDPFFTTKPEGTGLGLSICRQIVEDHRGTIRIDTSPGRGTTVAVSFPSTPVLPS